MNDRRQAIDAYVDALPENGYAPCPCGCGKKWKFCPYTPAEREERFIANWLATHPEID